MTQFLTIKASANESFSGCNFHKQDDLLMHALPLIKQHNKKIQHQDNYVSRDYLLSLINHIPLAIFCLDRNFNITSCSSAALFWLKRHYYKKGKDFSSKGIVGKKLSDIFGSYPKSLETALKNALKGKVWRSQSLKHKTSKKDFYHWLKWEVFPWLNKENEVTDIIICWEDITAYQELLSSYKRIQQNNALLESFNLVLSHDLMQPLRQISNFLDIVQENYRGLGPNEDSMNYVFNTMQKSFEHIRNLSEGIALYCKEGNLTVEPEKISLKHLVEEVHESILKTEKCQLNFHFSEDIYLYANRTCMLQLFQNLLANAIKHSLDNCSITLSGIKDDENFYKFHLHNHGYCPGYIRKKNVFLPFQSSTSEGAGLGLMICKKIISAYKGKITLHSGKQKGTVVSFTLPVYKVEKDPQKNREKFNKLITTNNIASVKVLSGKCKERRISW